MRHQNNPNPANNAKYPNHPCNLAQAYPLLPLQPRHKKPQNSKNREKDIGKKIPSSFKAKNIAHNKPKSLPGPPCYPSFSRDVLPRTKLGFRTALTDELLSAPSNLLTILDTAMPQGRKRTTPTTGNPCQTNQDGRNLRTIAPLTLMMTAAAAQTLVNARELGQTIDCGRQTYLQLNNRW